MWCHSGSMLGRAHVALESFDEKILIEVYYSYLDSKFKSLKCYLFLWAQVRHCVLAQKSFCRCLHSTGCKADVYIPQDVKEAGRKIGCPLVSS